MNFWKGTWNGLQEIWGHKLRSILTMICVMLGVASVVITMGFIEGLFANWKRYIAESGGLEKIAIINAEVPEQQRFQRGMAPPRTLQDAQSLVALGREIGRVSPEIDLAGARITRASKTFRETVQGVTPAVYVINRLEAQEGRLLVDADLAASANVIVLGAAAYLTLYAPGESVLGTVVDINGLPFQVVGRTKYYKLNPSDPEDAKGGAFPGKNRVSSIPLSAMSRKLQGSPDLTWLNVQVRNVERLKEAEQEIDNIMIWAHRGIHNFRVQTREEGQLEYEKMKRNFMLAGMAIGIVTLLVGGIGTMNLMLASINERVREIGIRKALGAWNSDIFLQFLAEAVVLSVLGGVIGIGLGVGAVGFLGTRINEFKPEFSWLAVIVGFGFSVFIGIVAGIYPALQASRLDPIEALRYE